MTIDFFIPTLKSQIAAAGVIDWFPIFMQEWNMISYFWISFWLSHLVHNHLFSRRWNM